MFDAKVNTLESIAPFVFVKISICKAGHVANELTLEVILAISRTGKLNSGSAKV